MIYNKSVSPDVLHLQDVEKPTPKDNEVLIKIHELEFVKLDGDIRLG